MESHTHHEGHDHSRNANSRDLTRALCLTGTFLLVEVIGGIAFDSLALLSDAAHMFTDTAALAIALAAIYIGKRAADEKKTFGYRRFEILAASFNAILLFAVAIYVLVEGIRRILEPAAVESMGMLAVAVVGLIVNLIAMRILSRGKNESLNVKGAYLEVWADMLGSVAVIIGAVVIRLTGWNWFDPVIAIVIGLWVLPRTWILLRDSTNILLESTPRGMVLNEIRSALLATPGVSGLHDFHVWMSGADQPSASMHIELTPDVDGEAVRRNLAQRLKEDFGIEHLTIQTEAESCEDKTSLHP